MTRLPDVSFLTVAEVAARLNVSSMSIYREIDAGELTAYRVGRVIRIDPRDFVQYMRAHQVGAA